MKWVVGSGLNLDRVVVAFVVFVFVNVVVVVGIRRGLRNKEKKEEEGGGGG